MHTDIPKKTRRRNKRKLEPGEFSSAAKLGLVGLNLPISVVPEELRRKALNAGFMTITTLICNIAMADPPEEIVEQPEGQFLVHVTVPRRVWVQWMLRKPASMRSPRQAMGKALSLWAERQKPVSLTEGEVMPWDEVDTLDYSEEDSEESSEE